MVQFSAAICGEECWRKTAVQQTRAFVTHPEDQEVGALSRRLTDNLGELAYNVCDDMQ